MKERPWLEGVWNERRALCLTLVLPLLFHGSFLVFDSLFSSDALAYIYGQKLLIRRELLSLRLPQFDPSVLCGTPLLANITAGVLYPLNILLLVGSERWAFHLFVIAHTVGAAVAMRAFLRRGLGVSGPACVVGAAAYAVSGYVRCSLDHLYFQSALWAPLFFLGLLGCVRSREGGRRFVRNWWLAAGALSIWIYSGNFQQALDASVFGIGLVVFWGWRHRGVSPGAWLAKRSIVNILSVFPAAALFSAPQLLPTYLASVGSVRSAGVAFSEATQLSFFPLRLMEYLCPGMLGAGMDYGWMVTRHYGGDFPWVATLFIGLPLILAVPSAVANRGIVRRWLMVVGVVSLLLAVGRWTPLYRFAYTFVPGFSAFRHPAKYLFWVHFVLISLGTVGLGGIVAGRRRRCAGWTIGVAGGFLLACLLGVHALRLLAPGVCERALLASGSQWTLPYATSWVTVWLSLSLFAAIGWGWAVWKRPGRHVLGMIALALTFGHLWLVERAMPIRLPSAIVTSAILASTHLPPGDRLQYRFLADPIKRKHSERPFPNLPLNEASALVNCEMMRNNAGTISQWRTTHGFSPVADERYLEFADAIPTPFLGSLCAVKYVILEGRVSKDMLPPDHSIVFAEPKGHYTIFANERARRRVSLFREHVWAPPGEGRVTALRMALKNAGQEVAPVVVTGLEETVGGVIDQALFRHATLQVLSDRPGRLSARVTGPAWLMLRDWYHPGWTAQLGGVAAPILEADGGFMAVRVPEGSWNVRLRFQSPGLWTGLALAILSFAAAAWVSRAKAGFDDDKDSSGSELSRSGTATRTCP
ncbi:MAG: hypothetical protein KAI66_04660 [Lentisphaeria bacterium]|nr:hypothetical protein [Lentisphaeria bacterium]